MFSSAFGQNQPKRSAESQQSLYLRLYSKNQAIGSGTGFLYKSATKHYLITNWHVVTNKNPTTKGWLDPNFPISPDRVEIYYHDNQDKPVALSENLIDASGQVKYYEYPLGQQMVDVVALPLANTNGAQLYPIQIDEALVKHIFIPANSQLFVIGYPLGTYSNDYYPIFKSGNIASDPDVDQQGLPLFWIDATGFPGMSGSPVYSISNQLTLKDGRHQMLGFSLSHLMGVFSGAPFGGKTGLGNVWKMSYLLPLFKKLP